MKYVMALDAGTTSNRAMIFDGAARPVAVLREGKIDRSKAKFRAYLASMTRRILIDRYRAAQVRPQPATGSVPNPVAGYVPSVHDNFSFLISHSSFAVSGSVPIDAIDPGAAVDILWRMAAHEAAKEHIFTKTALSDKSKEVYELIERGLSPREVASQLGVSYDSVKQVKSRINRAIAAIERRIVPAVATYL